MEHCLIFFLFWKNSPFDSIAIMCKNKDAKNNIEKIKHVFVLFYLGYLYIYTDYPFTTTVIRLFNANLKCKLQELQSPSLSIINTRNLIQNIRSEIILDKIFSSSRFNRIRRTETILKRFLLFSLSKQVEVYFEMKLKTYSRIHCEKML